VLLHLARLFLVIALLAGWQSALVHPLAHVDEQGRLVHLGAGSKTSSDASCDVLAALTACAPQATAIIAASPRTDAGSFRRALASRQRAVSLARPSAFSRAY
jgi:hypothetical protein